MEIDTVLVPRLPRYLERSGRRKDVGLPRCPGRRRGGRCQIPARQAWRDL